MSFHYQFKLISDKDFECRLSMDVSGGFWSMVLKHSINAMRSQGHHVSNDVSNIDTIIITPKNTSKEIIMALEKSVGKLFWKVARVAEKDGYKCVDYSLKQCIYKKTAGKWDIEAVLIGSYLKG